MNINSAQQDLLTDIFLQAVETVKGERCTAQYFQNHSLDGDIYLVAIGKAACSMASGAGTVLGRQVKSSLVITKHGHCQPKLAGIRVLEAGHPVPDQKSLDAGNKLLSFLNEAPAHAKFLFLISGGTSALVEVLPESITIEDLVKLNNWLLQSGLSIEEMNAVRKQVSCIKGGRLAQHLSGRQATVLLISDVQGDSPAVIGSGLLFPSDEISQIINKIEFPEFIQRMLNLATHIPIPDDTCFKAIDWKIVANLQQAITAAENSAISHGFPTKVHKEYLQGDAVLCGQYIAHVMRDYPGVLHIWGGETTVVLPPNPGKGGRCQSLALSAAIELAGHDRWSLLAAGTDGDDGVTGAAGVSIDSTTLVKAQQKLATGTDPRVYLQNADAGTFFEASGSLIKMGSTGTNVTDLVMAYMEQ